MKFLKQYAIKRMAQGINAALCENGYHLVKAEATFSNVMSKVDLKLFNMDINQISFLHHVCDACVAHWCNDQYFNILTFYCWLLLLAAAADFNACGNRG